LRSDSYTDLRLAPHRKPKLTRARKIPLYFRLGRLRLAGICEGASCANLEPRYYKLPWNEKTAALQNAIEQNNQQHSGGVMNLPFEHSLDRNKPEFYPLPEPKLPGQTSRAERNTAEANRRGASMCTEYERYVDRYAYCKLMQDLKWGTPTRQSEDDLPRAGSVRVRGVAPVIRAAGRAVEPAQVRWSFPPAAGRQTHVQLPLGGPPLQG
jgi:hypothetical protein